MTGEFLKWSPVREKKPSVPPSGRSGNGDGRNALELSLAPSNATIAKFYAHSTMHAKQWTPEKDAILNGLVTRLRTPNGYSRHMMGTRESPVDWKAVQQQTGFVHTKVQCEMRWNKINNVRPSTVPAMSSMLGDHWPNSRP